MDKKDLLSMVNNRDYMKMNKKELKEFIEKNGYWTKSKINRIDTNKVMSSLKIKDKTKTYMKKTKDYLNSISEDKSKDLIFFEGIISQNYGVGERSMNGYKIDQDGWDISKFSDIPQVYLQHDMDEPIGRSVYLYKDENGNTVSSFFLDKTLMDEVTKNRIEEGYITGISTGHITIDSMIEDENGNMMTLGDAREKDGDKTRDAFFGEGDRTYVVTNALLLEFSMVTMGSNEEAIATRNIVSEETKNKFLSLKNNMKPNQTELNEEIDTTAPVSEDVVADVNTEETEENTVEEKVADITEDEVVKENQEEETETVVTNDTDKKEDEEQEIVGNDEPEQAVETKLDERLQQVENALGQIVTILNTMQKSINNTTNEVELLKSVTDLVATKNELLHKKVNSKPVLNLSKAPNDFMSKGLNELAASIDK